MLTIKNETESRFFLFVGEIVEGCPQRRNFTMQRNGLLDNRVVILISEYDNIFIQEHRIRWLFYNSNFFLTKTIEKVI